MCGGAAATNGTNMPAAPTTSPGGNGSPGPAAASPPAPAEAPANGGAAPAPAPPGAYPPCVCAYLGLSSEQCREAAAAACSSGIGSVSGSRPGASAGAASSTAAAFSSLCAVPKAQLADASSLAGGVLQGVYSQLRDQCFPGALSAPSFCSCGLVRITHGAGHSQPRGARG